MLSFSQSKFVYKVAWGIAVMLVYAMSWSMDSLDVLADHTKGL